MSEASFEFRVGEATTGARVYRVAGARATLVLAHGAGAPQGHPWMVAMARAISERGVEVVTFDFLYMSGRGSRPARAPDRNDVLEATWRGAIGAVRARSGVARLFVGGKSMGGRIASQVAAGEDVDVAGIVLLGYPLHPPGKPRQLRTAHLPRVRAPMLFVQGTRDALGTPEELAPFVKGCADGSRVFVVEGGDHSFALPKSAGVTREQVIARIADEVSAFIA